jgi:hypothetical protein
MSRQPAYVLRQALAPHSASLRRARAGVPAERRPYLLAHAVRLWVFAGAIERRSPCA